MFEQCIEACKHIAALSSTDSRDASNCVEDQLQANVDARMFEIASFAVLKVHYGENAIS